MKPLILLLAFASSPAAYAHGEQSRSESTIGYSRAEPTAFGVAADPRKATRTIRVEMRDTFRFVPDNITLRQGQTVRFVVANKGKMPHEMVLGTMQGLKEHAALMEKFPGMEHDEPSIAHVAPSGHGEIGWRFSRAGTYYFACLVPGHFEAGMIGTITVVPSPRKGSRP